MSASSAELVLALQLSLLVCSFAAFCHVEYVFCYMRGI